MVKETFEYTSPFAAFDPSSYDDTKDAQDAWADQEKKRQEALQKFGGFDSGKEDKKDKKRRGRKEETTDFSSPYSYDPESQRVLYNDPNANYGDQKLVIERGGSSLKTSTGPVGRTSTAKLSEIDKAYEALEQRRWKQKMARKAAAAKEAAALRVEESKKRGSSAHKAYLQSVLDQARRADSTGRNFRSLPDVASAEIPYTEYEKFKSMLENNPWRTEAHGDYSSMQNPYASLAREEMANKPLGDDEIYKPRWKE